MRINNVPAAYNGTTAVLRRSSTPGYWNAVAADATDTRWVGSVRVQVPRVLGVRLTSREAAAIANDPSDAERIYSAPDTSD
jgi:hypothetical protein